MKHFYKKMENLFVKCLSRFDVSIASKYLFLRAQGKKLNLKMPKTFNEKLMYIKLYDYTNNPTVWECCDKYQLRKYVKSQGISEDHLPEIIKTYSDAKNINFDKLPNKFALKCSHGCGYNIICTDKAKLDEEKTKKQLNKWLKTKFGYETAEPHYTHVKPRIICEKFIGNDTEYPWDYKLYCFNGEPKVVLVCTDREKGHYKTHFYDVEWNKLKLRDNQSEKDIKQPKTFNEMISISKTLAKPFPFVRMDFYEWNGKAILGEMTFTPAACLAKYNKFGDEYLSNLLRVEKYEKQ